MTLGSSRKGLASGSDAYACASGAGRRSRTHLSPTNTQKPDKAEASSKRLCGSGTGSVTGPGNTNGLLATYKIEPSKPKSTKFCPGNVKVFCRTRLLQSRTL